jgi:hypothetical protein
MTKPKVHYLRYLAPKDAGLGELVGVISVVSEEPFTLSDWRAKQPELFIQLGFYTLMESKADYLTVEAEKKK